MTHTVHKVAVFHKTFNQPIADQPTVADAKLRAFRLRLIAEELGEMARACGYSLLLSVDPRKGEETDYLELLCREEVVPDMVEMADALGDLDYVVQGANLVFGFPSEAVLDEIQASNMSKLGEDGKPLYREDGKVLKGPHYFRPDIARVLGAARHES